MRTCLASLGAFAWTVVVPAAVALAACGGSSSTEPADSLPPRESAPRSADPNPSVIGKAPPATGGYPSVIILEPQAPHRFPVPAEPQVMDQYGTDFHPRVLLVQAGQPVLFRNSEDLGHNVYVTEAETGSPVLNVDTPMYGSHEHTFERTGVYRIRCHIHPDMRAFILVTSTPHAVVADKDGNFSLSDVPPGFYNLTVWNVDASRRIERVVEIEEPRTELTLEKAR